VTWISRDLERTRGEGSNGCLYSFLLGSKMVGGFGLLWIGTMRALGFWFSLQG
jgi:hypothetical protein